jgi:hypothetical protein
MKRRLHICIVLLFLGFQFSHAQEKENIKSSGDTFTYKKLDVIETEEDNSPIKETSFKKDESPTSARTSSSGIGETPGHLSVSLTGAATYEMPIAAPPGIKGVAPEISFRYNSQAKDGVAGYGWNIINIKNPFFKIS